MGPMVIGQWRPIHVFTSSKLVAMHERCQYHKEEIFKKENF